MVLRAVYEQCMSEKTKNAKRTPSGHNEETNESERTDRKLLSGRHNRFGPIEADVIGKDSDYRTTGRTNPH